MALNVKMWMSAVLVGRLVTSMQNVPIQLGVLHARVTGGMLEMGLNAKIQMNAREKTIVMSTQNAPIQPAVTRVILEMGFNVKTFTNARDQTIAMSTLPV